MELTIEEIQNETLKIMKVIDSVCKKLNLKYVLYYGTLIGAIRHNGFIPWDDDLDILMPRKDYNELAKYFIEHKKELEPYVLFSNDTIKNYPYYINRICNTTFRMEAENERDCGMGTFVDIYPLDGAGNGKHLYTYAKARFYSSMYFIKNQTNVIKSKNIAIRIAKTIIHFLSKFYTYNTLYKKLEKISQKYDYEKSKFIAPLTWSFSKYDLFEHKDIEELQLAKFEDNLFYIPKNYDKLLRRQYGDYMKLPPENERVGHHYYRIFRK